MWLVLDTADAIAVPSMRVNPGTAAVSNVSILMSHRGSTVTVVTPRSRNRRDGKIPGRMTAPDTDLQKQDDSPPEGRWSMKSLELV